uniref:Uncharacterized protein n=1 Tax=Arundo donax TaxID=35708 RepID=A0A0A9C179_ARUDO
MRVRPMGEKLELRPHLSDTRTRG